jgi:hypothetical protein
MGHLQLCGCDARLSHNGCCAHPKKYFRRGKFRRVCASNRARVGGQQSDSTKRAVDVFFAPSNDYSARHSFSFKKKRAAPILSRRSR